MIPELPVEFDLALARKLAGFSSQAYEASDDHTVLFDALTDAHVLIEDIGDAIVLAFRGTKEARDWLTDADFLKTPLVMGGRARLQVALPPRTVKVHRGFLRAIDSLLPKIIAWLEGPNMGSAPKPLLITGHSLGGALASLAAFFLSRRGHQIRAVYTFASPRVGNGIWRLEYNHGSTESRPTALGEKTFRLAAAGDLVPLLPGLLDGYRHVGQEVFLRASQTPDAGRQTPEIQINSSHILEILQDEWRAIRALGQGNLDFILQFHSIDKDYIPLLGKQTHAETPRREADCGQAAGGIKMGTFNTQHSTPNAK